MEGMEGEGQSVRWMDVKREGGRNCNLAYMYINILFSDVIFTRHSVSPSKYGS